MGCSTTFGHWRLEWAGDGTWRKDASFSRSNGEPRLAPPYGFAKLGLLRRRCRSEADEQASPRVRCMPRIHELLLWDSWAAVDSRREPAEASHCFQFFQAVSEAARSAALEIIHVEACIELQDAATDTAPMFPSPWRA